jgi:hypothetical protein
MDNAQKHHICTNVPSSQTFRSYLHNQYGPGVYPNFRKFERHLMERLRHGPRIRASSAIRIRDSSVPAVQDRSLFRTSEIRNVE